MNKVQKLIELNKDIELLESFGKFKSASILHEKFIKEAQIKPVSYATEDRGFTYEKYFNDKLRKLQNAQNKDLVISEIRSDGFLKEEDKQQIINAISNSEKSAPVGQLSDQVKKEQKDHQAYLNSAKTPLIQLQEKEQQKSPVQNLSDTANQNAAMENLYSAANAYKAPEDSFTNSDNLDRQPELAKLVRMQSEVQPVPPNLVNPLFNDLLDQAKEYLSNNQLNDAATIRQQAMESEMTPAQKIDWMQEYNILVQNFSGSKTTNTKNFAQQQDAINKLKKATESLGIAYNAKDIANNESRIIEWFYEPYSPPFDNSTRLLLRQISLSAYPYKKP